LKNRLDNFVGQVTSEAANYERAARRTELHTVPVQTLAGQSLTVDELVKVYDDRMANVLGPGRQFYEQLRSSAPNDECPFCSHGVVKSLDHYLPKRQYPILAVVPVNLVPSCMDCNKRKLATAPRSAEECLLHPYYDDVENDTWLNATVQQTSPPALSFYVQRPAGWNDLIFRRLEYHFGTLGLADLYSTQAARLVSEIKVQIQRLFDAGGANAVREHLIESALSRRAVNMNSWQFATFNALSLSDWYCTGGFG
jgi:hypothetical protein